MENPSQKIASLATHQVLVDPSGHTQEEAPGKSGRVPGMHVALGRRWPARSPQPNTRVQQS